MDVKQARPLLEEYAIEELIDPRLDGHYAEQEVYCMLHAASLCIRRDPYSRPRMSQVNKVLNTSFFFSFSFWRTWLALKNQQLHISFYLLKQL